MKEFPALFESKFSVPLLESKMQILFQRKDSFVGSKCLKYTIKYIVGCTKIDKPMEMLKPYVERILFHTIMPIMLINQKDIESFENDPVEYIRNLYEFEETLF